MEKKKTEKMEGIEVELGPRGVLSSPYYCLASSCISTIILHSVCSNQLRISSSRKLSTEYDLVPLVRDRRQVSGKHSAVSILGWRQVASPGILCLPHAAAAELSTFLQEQALCISTTSDDSFRTAGCLVVVIVERETFLQGLLSYKKRLFACLWTLASSSRFQEVWQLSPSSPNLRSKPSLRTPVRASTVQSALSTLVSRPSYSTLDASQLWAQIYSWQP